MKIKFLVKNDVEISDKVREGYEKKLLKLEKIFNHVTNAEVEFALHHGGVGSTSKTVEIKVLTARNIILYEASSSSFKSSFDVALDKVVRQLRRLKTKLVDKPRSLGKDKRTIEIDHTIPAEIIEKSVVKIERISSKPITQDEAITAAKNSHLGFYVYMDQDSHEINVMYKLEGGGFCLLIPGN